jgi:rSAM/selenodomain-associated transferase 1
MLEKSALVVFTLSPEAEGKRKPLGLGRPERAAAVYRALLRHLENVCSDLPGVDLFLSTPNKRIAGTEARHLPQRGAHFGESLRLAVEDAFALGYERVVVIGNDAPEICKNYLRTAFERLDDRSSRAAVLGPARDGGYVLLGLTRPCPQAFEAMPWGSRRVARLTEERLTRSGFEVDQLPALDDIDNPRSLVRFLARAGREELTGLTKEIASLLSTTRTELSTHIKRVPEILLVGWRGLRAPPLFQ